MGRGSRLPLEQLQPYLLETAPATGPLDFNELFGSAFPVELEIGFGKGLFLATAAAAHPQVNFLGLEIERRYYFVAANRIAKKQLTNVRLACGDARQFVPMFVADGSLQAVHIYFPDPWWKNRHRKRRLFTEAFADQCQRILRPGGMLQLASDVEDYFQLIAELFDRRTEFERGAAPEVSDPEHDLDYLTNFERKYRKEGRPIWRAGFLRK